MKIELLLEPMEGNKLSYEDLLIKVKEQDLRIQEIEREFAAKNNFSSSFQSISKASPVLIYSMRKSLGSVFSFPFASDAIQDIYGFSHREIENDSSKIFELIHVDDLENVILSITTTESNLQPLHVVYRYHHPTKGLVWHEVNSIPTQETETDVVCHGVVSDITQRVETEQKMYKVKRLYRFISRINQIIVRAKDEQQLFKEVCTAAVEIAKFKMAWIGLIDEITQNVIPVSMVGDDEQYLSDIRISAKIQELTGQGPVGIAIRQEKFKVCNTIEDDPIMKPWREEALKRGYHSLIAIPIKKFDKTIGIFVIYAADRNYFNSEEIKLLSNAAVDVTFALEFFEREAMRKEAENKFIKTTKKLEAIIEAIPDLMFEINLNGVFFNYHSPDNDLLVMPPGLFIGKKITEVLPLDAAAICLSALKETHEKGLSRGKQYTLDFPQGRRWFELSIAPMKEVENNEPHFIAISRDITEKKLANEALVKSKERYRGLLGNLEAGIVVHAVDGTIIKCNSKAAELLGYNIQELMFGSKDSLKWNFFNDDYSEMVADYYPINQIVNSRKSIKNFPLGIKNKVEKDIIWVLVNGFPMLDENGDIQEVVISFIDITEQKKLNLEIKKSKELAESANKYKTDFLANMSHEIRTPLNGIVGFTSLLMESYLEENQHKYMLTINESAKTLMDIVNDILDFSKIEAGKLELKIEEVDLFALINQVFSLFKYQANQKQIDLVLHIDSNVPQFIFADSLRLKQIIINLIGNAIKFTKKGRILLNIKAILPLEKNYANLYFSIKDTGIGIQSNNQHKIFNSFVQEDNSISRQFGGTGLGLSISNQLLALMNSKLELESTYGEGSLFYFHIRFQKSNKKYQFQQGKNDKETIVTIPGAKRILIVEDNTINMLLAKTLVQKIIPEAIIFQAFDGDEAIEQYKKQSFDIILMDIQMPNKNGFEATYEIRRIEKNSFTPIIALTAGIFVEEKEECLKSGMNDYITKPIVISDLELILFEWLVKRLISN